MPSRPIDCAQIGDRGDFAAEQVDASVSPTVTPMPREVLGSSETSGGP